MPTGRLVEKWGPFEEQIVFLHATGHFSEADLAKRLGVSTKKINGTIRDPRAEEIRQILREKIRENLIKPVEDQLPLLANDAVRVLRRTLEADIAPTHSMKANQDRVALEVLKGLGYLNGNEGGQQPGLTLTPEQFGVLKDALERSNRVREIEALPEVPATVVE